jgi:hypothetical protein
MATQNNVIVRNECDHKEINKLKEFDKMLLRQDLNVSGTEVAINDILVDNKVTTLEGLLSDGAKYKMRIPSNFNGIVFLKSKGYRFPFDIPELLLPGGYTVDTKPEIVPGINGRNNDDKIIGYQIENFLLKRGVAIIGSGNPIQGWNANVAVNSNKLLLDLFKSKYITKKVVVWGESLGSNITQAFAEKYPDQVDAVGLISYTNSILELLHYCGDILWLFKNIFDSTIKAFDYNRNQDPSIEVYSDMGKVKQFLLYLSKNPAVWPNELTNLPPIGVQLKTNQVPPLLVLLLLNYITDLPDKSAHYDSVSLSLAVTKNYIHKTFATIENIVDAIVLGVVCMQDLEKQCGGVVYDNNKVNYTTRLSNTDREYFNFITTDLSLNRDVVLNTILGSIATAPRITCNQQALAKMLDPNGTINIVADRVRKPTFVVTSRYDNVTPAYGLSNLYNTVKIDPLASNKLLALLLEAPEKYTQFDGQLLPRSDVPKAQGTGHVIFNINEWLSFTALLLYAVENNQNLSGDKLNNLLVTLPNMKLCNDTVVNSIPLSFYNKELSN